MEVPRLGVIGAAAAWPTPQPQQHGVGAASRPTERGQGLNPCPRGFVSTVPQQELPYFGF